MNDFDTAVKNMLIDCCEDLARLPNTTPEQAQELLDSAKKLREVRPQVELDNVLDSSS